MSSPQPLSQHRQALAVHSIDCSPHPLPACTLPRWRRHAAQAINRYRELRCLLPSWRSAMSAHPLLVNAQSYPSSCVMRCLYISRPVAAPISPFFLQQVCQVQSCCVRFCLFFFLPLPFFSLLSSGLVPSNHYTTDDLFPIPIFAIIQFFVAGPLQRNTQLYLLETNNQNHTDNANSQPSARLSTYTQPHQQSRRLSISLVLDELKETITS